MKSPWLLAGLLVAGCSTPVVGAASPAEMPSYARDAMFIGVVSGLPDWGSDSGAVTLAQSLCDALDIGVSGFEVQRALRNHVTGTYEQTRAFQNLAIRFYCPHHAGK